MRKVTSIIFTFCLFLLNSLTILANENSYLVCDDVNCEPEKISPFFAERILWQPGTSYSSIITIKNSSESNHYIGHKAQRTISLLPNEPDIAKVMEIKVTRMSVNKVVFKSLLSDFYNSQGASLGILGDGKTDSYKYDITMLNASNEYQGKKTQFDLVFGFFFPTPTPSNTPIPTNALQPINSLTPSTTLAPILYPATNNTPAPAQILEDFFSNSVSYEENDQIFDSSLNTKESGQVDGASSGSVKDLTGNQNSYIMVPQNDPHYFSLGSVSMSSEDLKTQSLENKNNFNLEGFQFLTNLVLNFFEKIILFIAQMVQ